MDRSRESMSLITALTVVRAELLFLQGTVFLFFFLPLERSILFCTFSCFWSCVPFHLGKERACNEEAITPLTEKQTSSDND